jgi:hypothetical protein
MIDPILRFPRVIHERRDPNTADDRSVGIMEGNIWINIDTGRVYICVNSEFGTWVAFIVTGQTVAGADFGFGDGSTDLSASFNLGENGIFTVYADNITINEEGNILTDGHHVLLNRDLVNDNAELWAYALDPIENERKDGVLSWTPAMNCWRAGLYKNDDNEWSYLTSLVSCVFGYRDPIPDDNFSAGYHLGQVWINLVTQQKFTCMSCPDDGGPAVWRLALTSAPTKSMVEYDDYIILYGENDDTFMKISVNDFALYIQDVVGGFGTSSAGYGWILDANDNLTLSEEDPITQGVFEQDGAGDFQPVEGATSDQFFEFDGDDNIQPKAA